MPDERATGFPTVDPKVVKGPSVAPAARSLPWFDMSADVIVGRHFAVLAPSRLVVTFDVP